MQSQGRGPHVSLLPCPTSGRRGTAPLGDRERPDLLASLGSRRAVSGEEAGTGAQCCGGAPWGEGGAAFVLEAPAVTREVQAGSWAQGLLHVAEGDRGQAASGEKAFLSRPWRLRGTEA